MRRCAARGRSSRPSSAARPTLLFAFLPLLVLPETAGKFIRVLPVTVMTTIIGSLLIALFIIPFIASRVLAPAEAPAGNRVLQRLMGGHRALLPAGAGVLPGAPAGHGDRRHRRLA